MQWTQLKNNGRENDGGAPAGGETLFWVVGKIIFEEVTLEWKLSVEKELAMQQSVERVNGQNHKRWNDAFHGGLSIKELHPVRAWVDRRLKSVI